MARREEKDLGDVISSMGIGFEVVKVLVHAILKKGGTIEHLRRLLKEPDLVEKIVSLVLIPVANLVTVVVQSIPAPQLVEWVKGKLTLTYLNLNFATWDFLRGEGGKRFEVLTWAPGRWVSSDEVRTYFRGKGSVGNTAAFLSWIGETNPEGYWVSIPEDEHLWRHPRSGSLCAPNFLRDGSRRRLSLSDV